MLRKLHDSLDTTSRGWLAVLAGQFGRLALGFIASVLIARSLGPTDLGLYGVLAAATAFLSILTDLGLNTTIAQRLAEVWPGAKAAAQHRARVFLWTRLGITFFIILAGLALTYPLVQLLLPLNASAALWWRLTLLGVAATALSGSLSALLRGSSQFWRIPVVLLTNAGLTAVLAIVLTLSQQLTISTALLVLGIIPTLASCVVAYRLLPDPLDMGWPAGSWRQEQRELWRFGRWLGLSNLLVVLTTQMDVILLTRWWAGATIGLYFLALNLVTKLEIVNQSLYTVLVPAAATLTDRAHFGAYLRRSLKRSVAIVALLSPLLLLVEPFIRLFYGVDFVPAVALFRWLFVLLVFDIMTLPVTLLAFPLQQPKLLAAADGVRALIFIMIAAWLIPPYGPIGVIAAKGVAKLVGFVLTLLLLRPFQVSPVPAQKNAPNI